jgi:general stress protein 26
VAAASRYDGEMKPNERAQSIIRAINYITIATVGDDGQPWNTPVAGFRFEDDYTLYWASWQDNQHSRNIRSNGKAFVVIYDSTPADGNPSAGVYMQGRAYELTSEKEVMQAALVFEGDQYNPSDGRQYMADYPRRMYKFAPEKFWLNDDDSINGNFIDIRKTAEGS